MTDIPIMFSAPMVQAEIDDLKFMSRRLAKRLVKTYPNGRGNPPTVLVERDAPWTRVKVGDRLWVREEWRVSRKWDAVKPADLPPRTMTVAFDAGGSIANQPAGCWAPDNGYPARGVRPEWLGKRRASMHLPRWASRLTLIVTSVKTEPLHAISPDDVYAEGVAAGMMDCGERMFICPVQVATTSKGQRPGLFPSFGSICTVPTPGMRTRSLSRWASASSRPTSTLRRRRQHDRTGSSLLRCPRAAHNSRRVIPPPP